MKTRSLLAVAAAALVAAAGAHAGRSCDTKPLTAATLERGLELALRTHQALESEHALHGTEVVLLARAGQDLTKYGLRYSHLGFAIRDQDARGQPVWHVVHKLNHCGRADSALYRQGLGEFFLDDLWRFESAWAVPTPAVQLALAAQLRSNERAAQLHHKPYSLVSYVWSQRYQQSNQWAIETLAAAVSPGVAGTRAGAQELLQAPGSQPTTLRIGPLTRLGARAGLANIAFDDHPDAKRFSDRIETVTVDSVFAWMPRAGLGAPPATAR
jgi:hypothetical protein